MLAHGTRPAARPRSSSPTPWKARPSVVVAIAIPTALRCGTTSAGAAITVVPPASRAPPPSLAAASLASATLASATRRATGRPTRSARCARSNANATNPRAYAVVAPTTSRVLSSPRSIATPVLTRGRAPDRVHHPFQLTGKAQVVPAGKGGGVDNCTSVMIGHSEPDPPPWCEQGHREPGKGGQREPEDRSERRVMAQVERDEPRGALPGQRPQPTRQVDRPARLDDDRRRRAVRPHHLLHAGHVQLVDVLRQPGVQAEVPVPDGEHQQRRVRLRVHRRRPGRRDDGGRQQEPDDADLVAGGHVRHLDHAARRVDRVLREEGDRTGEGDLTLGVAHHNVRGVSVALQVDVGATDGQRVVHPDDGRPGRSAVIRVNHPLSVGGANVYLQGNGYAPDVVVRDAAGEVAFAGAVPFLPQDAVYTSRGVIKVPDVSTGDQIGIVGFLLPTAVVTPAGAASVYPQPDAPLLVLTVWHGDLGLDTGLPQNVYELDVTGMEQVVGADGTPTTIVVEPGRTVDLPGGLGTLTWQGTPRFVALDLRHDPALGAILGFALAALAGLTVSLFTPRRRIWLRVTDHDGRTVVDSAALARGDDLGLAGELERVMDAIRGATPGEDRSGDGPR